MNNGAVEVVGAVAVQLETPTGESVLVGHSVGKLEGLAVGHGRVGGHAGLRASHIEKDVWRLRACLHHQVVAELHKNTDNIARSVVVAAEIVRCPLGDNSWGDANHAHIIGDLGR